jgi:hypothetical protein
LPPTPEFGPADTGDAKLKKDAISKSNTDIFPNCRPVGLALISSFFIALFVIAAEWLPPAPAPPSAGVAVKIQVLQVSVCFIVFTCSLFRG